MYQLTVALQMLFLYSDDGSHFKHNKTPHKMTCRLVSVQGWQLNTGKSNKERDKHRTATGWPRPLNGGGRLIQVTNIAFV